MNCQNKSKFDLGMRYRLIFLCNDIFIWPFIRFLSDCSVSPVQKCTFYHCLCLAAKLLTGQHFPLKAHKSPCTKANFGLKKLATIPFKYTITSGNILQYTQNQWWWWVIMIAWPRSWLLRVKEKIMFLFISRLKNNPHSISFPFTKVILLEYNNRRSTHTVK